MYQFNIGEYVKIIVKGSPESYSEYDTGVVNERRTVGGKREYRVAINRRGGVYIEWCPEYMLAKV